MQWTPDESRLTSIKAAAQDGAAEGRPSATEARDAFLCYIAAAGATSGPARSRTGAEGRSSTTSSWSKSCASCASCVHDPDPRRASSIAQAEETRGEGFARRWCRRRFGDGRSRSHQDLVQVSCSAPDLEHLGLHRPVVRHIRTPSVLTHQEWLPEASASAPRLRHLAISTGSRPTRGLATGRRCHRMRAVKFTADARGRGCDLSAVLPAPPA